MTTRRPPVADRRASSFYRFAWVALLITALGACGGPESPFRVGELQPIEVDSDLAALARSNSHVEPPSQPTSDLTGNLGAEPLFAVRPDLVASPEEDAGAVPDGEDTPAPLALSLLEAIVLGLRQNRSIQSSYLNRVVEKFALYVEEEEFVPRFETLEGSVESAGGSGETSGRAGIGTNFNWQTPYGTFFSAAIDNALTFTNLEGVDESGSASLELSVTQPLLRGAGFDVATAQLRLARLGDAQNRLALKAAVIDTITQVIGAYLDYVAQERNVDIVRRDLERSQQLLESNRLAVAAGRMASNEVFQTELSVSNSELALQDARDSLDRARLALLNLLSVDPRTPLEPTLQLEPEPVEVDVNRARAVAYDNNPTLLTQRLQVEQQRVGLLLSQNNLLPQLDVRAGYGFTGTDRTIGGAIGNLPGSQGLWALGVNVSIPLDRRTLNLALVGAEVGLEQAKLGETDARENLDSSVRDAVRSVDDGWRRYQISRRSVELARQTLAAEQAKLRAGRTTNFEVLARQATLQQAEVNELNTVISYLLALATLDQQLGTTLATWGVDLNDDTAASLLVGAAPPGPDAR